MKFDIICAMAVAMLPVGVGAASEPAPRYVVGVEDVRYSPHYDHDGDEFLGVAREMLDRFATQYGIQFEYRVLPVNRLYTELVSARSIDFKYPDSPDWRLDLKADAVVHYSAPCIDYIDGLMVLPQLRGKPVSNLKSIGTLQGFTPVSYQPLLQAGALRLEESQTAASLLKMAIMQRVDGAYLNVDVGRYYLRHILREPYALAWDPSKPYVVGSYRLSTVKHPEIIKAMDDFLIRNRVWLDDLKKRYHVSDAVNELAQSRR